MKLITTIYNLLWGDLVTIPLPGGGSLGLSLLVLLLIPAGIFFTARTRFLPVRLFPEMLKTAVEKRTSSQKNSISGFQTLIIATATRVGMGNLVGVVAAISAGGAGAVFWMWVTALLGSSTAVVEAPLAQLHDIFQRLPHPASLYHHPSGASGGCDRTEKKCHGQGPGYYGPHYGWLLLFHHPVYYF